MRNLIIFISLFLSALAFGQSRDDFFIESGNLYLKNKYSEALELVNEGLYNFPNDKKLEALKKKLEEEEKKNNKKNNQENRSNSQKNNQKEQNDSQTKEQNNETPENDGEDARRFNEDLQREMYNNILKSLEKEEKRTRRRMMREMGQVKSVRKEKDW